MGAEPLHPIRHVFFEAVLSPVQMSERLEKELAGVGYDRRALFPTYPGEVFLRCLEVLRRDQFPGLTDAEGTHRAGRLFVEGFRQTLLGRVATTALPMLGPARFLSRLPGRLQSVRPDVQVEVEVAGASSAVLTFTDPLPLGDFFAGVLEGALALAGAAGPKVLCELRPGGYVLRLSW